MARGASRDVSPDAKRQGAKDLPIRKGSAPVSPLADPATFYLLYKTLYVG
jgi:hypothetical protein